MGILNRLWTPKSIVHWRLKSIDLKDNGVFVLLGVKYREDFLTDQVKSLMMIERISNKVISHELKYIEHKDAEYVFRAKLNEEQLWESFEAGGIWDAFVTIKNRNGFLRKRRVKSDLNAELPHIFSHHFKKMITPYSTVKGNLSFKLEVINSAPKVLKTSLTSDGVLTLQGYLFDQNFLSDANNESVSIVFESQDAEMEKTFPVRLIEVEKLAGIFDEAEIFAEIRKKSNIIGFDVTVPLNLLDFTTVETDTVNVLLKVSNPDETAEYSNHFYELEVNDESTYTKEVAIIAGAVNSEAQKQEKKKVAIKVDRLTHYLMLSVHDYSYHIEIQKIFAENGKILMDGKLMIEDKFNQQMNGRFDLIVKKRQVDVINRIPISIVDSAFSCEIDVDSMIKSEQLRMGIWDLYLEIDERQHRLVTTMDNIPNKQKVMKFPQQLCLNKNNNAFTVKPYYTRYNQVSILVRNYVYNKSISNFFINKDEMTIDGKLNIMEPNDSVLDYSYTGNIVIKGQYGKKYAVPLRWELQKTNRTAVEFLFHAHSTMEPKEFGRVKKSIVNSIGFDSMIATIDFSTYRSPFMMNINQEKVAENSIGNRIIRRPLFMKFLNKYKLSFYRAVSKLLPVKSNVFVFQSFYGNSYACNPRAIYEKLLEYDKKIKAVWVMKNTERSLPGNPKLVKPRSFTYYYYMAVGRYFINNANFPDFYRKRPGTTLIETWHGTPLKRLGLDVDPNSPAYLENTSPKLLNRIKTWDYLIAPNHYTAEILQRAYNYSNKVLEIGYPRNDIFYQSGMAEKIKEIKRKLGIPVDKKVILYAPTWRDNEHQKGNKGQPYEFRFDLQNFKKRFGEEYVLLLRLHYFDASRINLIGSNDFVFNATYYDDIKELYLISDILITDYSSVMFDYANLSRPIIFFAFDFHRYESNMRGFYFDFKEKAPGPIVMNEEELFDALESINEIKVEYQGKYDAFKHVFCSLEDGQASRRVIESVFGNLLK